MSNPTHIPVLFQAVIEWANVGPASVVVDATVGEGGHAEHLLPMILPGGRYIGIDKDDAALTIARKRLAHYASVVELIPGRFSALCRIVKQTKADAALFDLGVSSPQLDDPEYGISFRSTGALDMRIGMGSSDFTAADIVNHWPPQDLKALLTEHGQPATNRLVDRIVEERTREPIITVDRLVRIIEEVVPPRLGIHPATRVLQGLRVAVNQEMDELEQGLEQAVATLKKQGRLLVISFHSGEDGAVKRFFHREEKDCICPPEYPTCVCDHTATLRILTAKPIGPTREEMIDNPRSRSAKLRIAERI